MTINDEKDRFGDKMRELERAREDQFFKKRDQELLEKLREKEHEVDPQAAPSEQCPKCGTRIDVRQPGKGDECPSCGATLS